MEDTYLTIDVESRTETRVKGSWFIGESFLVASAGEALTRLEQVRRREYQATHHCYAYVVGPTAGKQFKYSDDGEPSGTAGRPIYDAIVGRGLTNTAVVVTRYFGGTKLGTGGLARAYSEAARAVLDLSNVKTHYLTSRYRCVLDFSPYDSWQRALRQLGALVVDSQYADRVTMIVEIRKSRAEQLKAAFVQLTSGKGSIDDTES